MTYSFHPRDLLAILVAYGALLGGLLLLAAYPLAGVLLVLGSMALLLRSIANCCGAHTAPSEVDAENNTKV
jgi:hypothetical protein